MLIAAIFGILAGVIHLYIFRLESLAWGTPKVNKVFNVTTDQAEANRLFAYNQGFYNLFLALGLLSGVIYQLLFGEHPIAFGISLFSAASMLAAAVVLFSAAKHLIRAALIQGLMPLLFLLSQFFI